MSVVLVDAGGANIGSVRYALQRLGVEAMLTSDAEAIRTAERVILPGVGAAAPAMRRLRELDLIDTLRGLTQPVLGVCLGMQLLCAHSEEGDVDCLGLIDAPVRRIAARDGLRVPHMGWNRVSVVEQNRLFPDMATSIKLPARHSRESGNPEPFMKAIKTQRHWIPDVAVRFRDDEQNQSISNINDGWAYFVHSYAVPVCAATLASCEYGATFSAAIGRGNFMGVQFHPERSAALGVAVLRNFLAA